MEKPRKPSIPKKPQEFYERREHFCPFFSGYLKRSQFYKLEEVVEKCKLAAANVIVKIKNIYYEDELEKWKKDVKRAEERLAKYYKWKKEQLDKELEKDLKAYEDVN